MKFKRISFLMLKLCLPFLLVFQCETIRAYINRGLEFKPLIVETTVLKDFYGSMNGPSWVNSTGWNFTGTHNPCSEQWYCPLFNFGERNINK